MASPDGQQRNWTQVLGANFRSRPGRALLLLTTGLVSLSLLGALFLRFAIFHDERLRQLLLQKLHHRLSTPVELETLELSMGRLLLKNIRVGPPPGYKEDLLFAEQLELRWSLWSLWNKVLHIEQLKLGDAKLSYEENDKGPNIGHLFEPSSQEKDKPSPQNDGLKEEEYPNFELPLGLRFDRMEIGDITIALHQPNSKLTLDRLSLEGILDSDGRTLIVDAQLALGDRDLKRFSTLFLHRPKEKRTFEAKHHMELKIRSNNLDDINAELNIQAKVQVSDLPEQSTAMHGHAKLNVNLPQQEVQLQQFRWQFGERSSLNLGFELHEFMRNLRFKSAPIEASLYLEDLLPYAKLFAPQLQGAGSLNLSVDPIVFDKALQKSPWAINSSSVLELRDFQFQLAPWELQPCTGSLRLTSTQGSAEGQLEIHGAGLRAPPIDAKALNLQAEVKTFLQPWLSELPPREGSSDNSLSAELTLSSTVLESTEARIQSPKINVSVLAPVSLLQGKESTETIHINITTRSGKVQSKEASFETLLLNLEAQSPNLRGDTLATNIDAHLTGLEAMLLGQPHSVPLRLATLDLKGQLTRHGKHYAFANTLLSLEKIASLEIHGGLTHPMSDQPYFQSLRLQAKIPEAKTLLKMLPLSLRPPFTLSGSMETLVLLNGRVPFRRLQEELHLLSSQEVDSKDLGQQAMAYSRIIEAWTQRFKNRLPFASTLRIAFRNLALHQDSMRLTGGHGSIEAKLETSGFSMAAQSSLGTLESEGIRTEQNRFTAMLGVHENLISVESRAVTNKVYHNLLLRPIENAALELSGKYRIGGDLQLERLIFNAPDRAIEVALRGNIVQPLRILVAQSWQTSAWPGVETSLQGRLTYEGIRLEPLFYNGPQLEGKLSFDGHFGVKEGLAKFSGTMQADRFSLRDEENALQDMNGTLPFAIDLAFYPRKDAVPLNFDTPLGERTAWMLTHTQDIRDRPARPVHYARLRPYRFENGLRIRQINSGSHELFDLELDGRLENGVLVADRIGVGVLGGDVLGNFGLQLTPSGQMIGDLSVKMSNIDASNFKELKLKGGESSELNADMSLRFMFGHEQREIDANMNVTKIGEKALDRFLQLLDPTKKDNNIQDTRKRLGWVTIHGMALWLRYENLNYDLDYSSILPIKLPPLRRHSLSGQLDVQLQPIISKTLGPLLGWQEGIP